MTIPVYKPYLDRDEERKASSVIDSGWLSCEGEQTEIFEERIRKFLEVDYGLATDSGTAALHTALEAVGVEGKKVIVPGLTFGATVQAVKQAGGKPVIVDIEEENLSIDPKNLEQEIENDVAAVVVVHLFGRIGDMNQIKKIAGSADAKVVEDAAQAFGSSYKDLKAGTLGDIAAFSFSWNKTITTGKGGFVATDDPEMGSEIDSLVRNGTEDNRKFSSRGFNYRLDSIRASIGNSQMDKFNEISQRKREIFDRYSRNLSKAEGIETPEIDENTEAWAYHVLTDNRDKIREKLEEEGVATRDTYRPLTDLGIVRSEKELPVTQKISEKGLMLPSHPGLTDEEVDHIIENIRAALRTQDKN